MSGSIRTGLRVLDIAPGAYTKRWFDRFNQVDYRTLDLYDPDVDYREDLTKTSLPDASLDLILCFHVLEHIVDDVAAIRELRRLIRQDGIVLIGVPIGPPDDRASTFEDASVTTPEERLRTFGQDDHVRIYGWDVLERIRAGGFAVEVDDIARRVPVEEVRRFGMMSSEPIFVCRPL